MKKNSMLKKMMAYKVTVNLNMLGALMEHIVTSNMKSTNTDKI